MAKATGRNTGPAARMRGPADEAPPDEESAVGMENDDLDMGADDAAVEAGSGSSAVALSGDRAAARGATRSAPARTGPPAALMANPVTRFIVEAIIELRKVTWPQPADAWNMTLIVIAMSAFVAILLGAADFGLQKALTALVGWGLGGH